MIVLAGCCAAAGPLAAQEAEERSTTEVRELVEQLKQVQRANFELAQELADIQMAAATDLLAAAADGRLSSADHARLAERFANDAFVLASVPLAPIGTRGEAVSDALVALQRQLIERVDRALSGLGDPVATTVFEAFRDAQRVAEARAAQLEDGWTRYGDLMRLAELRGRLPVGSYDPMSRRWSLGSDEERLAGAAAGQSSSPEADRLAPGALPSLGGWIIDSDVNGFPAAVGADTADDSGGISSVTIRCNSDGTLRYDIDAATTLSQITVTFGADERAFVAVDRGAIVGAQALRMSDALRLAHESAAGTGRTAMIIRSEDPPAQASLPLANYFEARGAVLDACLPHERGVEEPSSPARLDVPTGDAPIPKPRPANRPLR